MSETEFDQMLSNGMRDMVSGCSLPEDFSDRLVKSVRGAKVVWRIKVVAVMVAVAATGVTITGFNRDRDKGKSQEPMLIAADAPSSTTEVSGWFLLGYLRECFKRNRNSKKKEEE